MNKRREITDTNLSRLRLADALQLDQHRSRPYPEHAAARELRSADDEIESLHKRVAELEALRAAVQALLDCHKNMGYTDNVWLQAQIDSGELPHLSEKTARAILQGRAALKQHTSE